MLVPRLFLLIFALFVSACTNSNRKTNNLYNSDSTKISDNVKIASTSINQNTDNDDESNDSNIVLKFKEFDLKITPYILSEDAANPKEMLKDTVFLLANLGGVDGDTLIIQNYNKPIAELKIEERYETTISIENEGPHWDLLGWKHYYSKWKPVKRIGQNSFTFIKYDLSQNQLQSTFPKFTLEELKKYVKESEDDEEANEVIKNIKSPMGYPVEIGISTIYLKISGKRKDNGIEINKIIEIEIPMGC